MGTLSRHSTIIKFALILLSLDLILDLITYSLYTGSLSNPFFIEYFLPKETFSCYCLKFIHLSVTL